MTYVNHPEGGMTYACPECDSSQVYTSTDRYRCKDCRSRFDEPVSRESYQSGKPTISDEDLIDDVRRVCDELGRGASCAEYNELGAYSASTVSNRLGYRETVKRAGHDPVPLGNTNNAQGPRTGVGRKLVEMNPEDLGLSPIGDRAD